MKRNEFYFVFCCFRSCFLENSQIAPFFNSELIVGLVVNSIALFSQVQKIDIGYAKTAKKMDVKRLKSVMWGLLTDNNRENKVCEGFFF